jgi:hypothetical protein
MATENDLQLKHDELPAEIEGDKISKIRDILFGNNMNEYEKRFAQLEERLNKSLSDISEDLNKKMGLLESFIKDEFSSLSDQLKQEETERISADKKNTKEIDYNETRLLKLKETTLNAQRDLKAQVFEKMKLLGSDFKNQNKEMQALLEKELEILQESKTDRSSLAVLLTELAIKLSGDQPEQQKDNI